RLVARVGLTRCAAGSSRAGLAPAPALRAARARARAPAGDRSLALARARPDRMDEPSSRVGDRPVDRLALLDDGMVDGVRRAAHTGGRSAHESLAHLDDPRPGVVGRLGALSHAPRYAGHSLPFPRALPSELAGGFARLAQAVELERGASRSLHL